MTYKHKKTASKISLILTVIVWGMGFVMSRMMMDAGLNVGFINSVRFITATVLIGTIFCKKIKIDKTIAIFGSICGAMLFFAFGLQIIALKYTTPAFGGFFTASYILFVPIIMLIFRKRRPTKFVLIGIFVAIVGFSILNFGGGANADINESNTNIMLGNLITIISAIFFSVQIVLCDFVLHEKETEPISFVFFQSAVTAVLFVIYFFIFEFKTTDFTAVSWGDAIFPLLFTAILGTAFAYTSQTFAQLFIKPSETSLYMSFEAVVGTIFSIIFKFDVFAWYILVGGILVTVALILVEVIPDYIEAKRLKKAFNIETGFNMEMEKDNKNMESEKTDDDKTQ